MDKFLEEQVAAILREPLAPEVTHRTCLHRGEFLVAEAMPMQHPGPVEDFEPHVHVVHAGRGELMGCLSEDEMLAWLFAGWLYDTGRLSDS